MAKLINFKDVLLEDLKIVNTQDHTFQLHSMNMKKIRQWCIFDCSQRCC